MEKVIYDEKNGLWYELQSDYYIPCLKLPEKERQPIGVWGQRRLRYIKQNRKVLYLNLCSCQFQRKLWRLYHRQICTHTLHTAPLPF